MSLISADNERIYNSLPDGVRYRLGGFLGGGYELSRYGFGYIYKSRKEDKGFRDNYGDEGYYINSYGVSSSSVRYWVSSNQEGSYSMPRLFNLDNFKRIPSTADQIMDVIRDMVCSYMGMEFISLDSNMYGYEPGYGYIKIGKDRVEAYAEDNYSLAFKLLREVSIYLLSHPIISLTDLNFVDNIYKNDEGIRCIDFANRYLSEKVVIDSPNIYYMNKIYKDNDSVYKDKLITPIGSIMLVEGEYFLYHK